MKSIRYIIYVLRMIVAKFLLIVVAYSPLDALRRLAFKILMNEHRVVDYFKPHRGDVVVDVGAYIGMYSMLSSRLVSEEGTVLAIEPHPLNYLRLVENIRVLRAKNVRPLMLALLDYDGYCKLYVAEELVSHSVLPISNSYITVPCRSLDSLLEALGIGDVGLIKVDVEGAELLVLRGAERTLRRSKNVRLIIECHGTLGEVRRYLRSLGFSIKIINTRRGEKIYHIYAVKPAVVST